MVLSVCSYVYAVFGFDAKGFGLLIKKKNVAKVHPGFVFINRGHLQALSIKVVLKWKKIFWFSFQRNVMLLFKIY